MQPETYPRPPWFGDMIAAAEKLASLYKFEFMRVDMYALADHPRFGEVTFFPDSGFGKFDPPIFDEIFGRMLETKSVATQGDMVADPEVRHAS